MIVSDPNEQRSQIAYHIGVLSQSVGAIEGAGLVMKCSRKITPEMKKKLEELIDRECSDIMDCVERIIDAIYPHEDE